MIKPTVGRVVWFYKYWANTGHKGPLAAIVSCVHSDSMVSLMDIGESGTTFGEQSVRLVQENEEVPEANYCCWMPFQIGQAKKTELLAEELSVIRNG